ncbi:type II toxin-antitoxin system RelE/ParE family toxin [Sphingopyxis sp. H050]|uniref:type II toxin-antitoxin system RelE/ParE family toxin n=1 Tax=Sphingopyxis sp. H050 TaxID=1759072 RepID=UPI001E5A71E3|nr:type II toxin-antitoxin system RelE/ParE family toxin [Sphingopyxis sp. H050]
MLSEKGVPLRRRSGVPFERRLTDLQRVQFRWPVGMPLVRPMGKGLFEVRTPLPDSTIARVLFCFHQGELYSLHGFIKKSQKAPAADLKLARKRQKEVENG